MEYEISVQRMHGGIICLRVSSPGTLWLHKIALDHFQRGVSEGLFLLPCHPEP